MIVYRITKKQYVHDLSGMGAFLFGGRWNQKSTRIIYTSGSLSLAMLEILVNLSSQQIIKGLYCAEIELPNNLVIDEIKKLPTNWNTYPHPGETTIIGSKFFKAGGFCLKVPSAMVPTEFNYLINPEHEHFDKIRIKNTKPLLLDQRLL